MKLKIKEVWGIKKPVTEEQALCFLSRSL